MTRTTTRATTRARRNVENPPGDPSQPSENLTQADPPGSDNAHRQDTTEGPTGNLREGADQRDVRSGLSEGRGQRQPNNQHPSDCDNARRGPPKLR